jgi:Transmembrane secretion effector
MVWLFERLSMLVQLRHPAIRTFLVIWIGQFISIVGSSLTTFALGVWVFRQTGWATDFALIAAFSTLPGIFLAPLAGSLVDRYNRRTVVCKRLNSKSNPCPFISPNIASIHMRRLYKCTAGCAEINNGWLNSPSPTKETFTPLGMSF